ASFQASFTDAGILDTHTATIDWGDNTTSAGTVVEQNGAGTVSSSHVYAEEGLYYVVVTVTDNGNASSLPAKFSVSVTDAPPTLTISGPSTVDVNALYTLGLSSTVSPDPVSGWTITWGDGSTSSVGGSASSASHTYTVASKYTITATGTTDDGALNANQQVVTINNISATVQITGPNSTS